MKMAIGVMSYRRQSVIADFLKSLYKTKDVRDMKVIVADDSGDDDDCREFLCSVRREYDFDLFMNNPRKGISANSNLILHQLKDFDIIFLANDDLVFLDTGWNEFYANEMMDSRVHHCMYGQHMLWGFRRDHAVRSTHNGRPILQMEKPMGQFLVLTKEAIKQIGYFDEQFGMYGQEHVDWSYRAVKAGLCPCFLDYPGSDSYIECKKVGSAVSRVERRKGIKENKKMFEQFLKDKSRLYLPYRG